MAFTFGLYIAFIALGISHVSLGPTLQGLADQTGSALGSISLLFVVRALGYMGGSFIGGNLYDRLPGKKVMVAALIGMAVTLFIIPYFATLWMMAIVMLLLGYSEGSLDVGGNTLLVWAHGEKSGPYMNALHFFYGLGAFLAPLILAQSLSLTGNIQWTFWGMALLMIPPMLWLSQIPSPQRPEKKQTEESGHTSTVWIALIALMFFLYVGIEASFGGWIFSYATESQLFTGTAAAYLNSGFWLAFTVGRLVGILLSMKMSSVRQLWLNLAGIVLSVALFILLPGSSSGVWIGSIVMGLALASTFPLLMNIASEVLNISGKVMGLFFLGASAGGMIIPWLIGQYFEGFGPSSLIITIAGLAALQVILFSVIGKKLIQNTAPISTAA